jgi:hypothetical protein
VKDLHIYSTDYGFAAITEDDFAITWGIIDYDLSEFDGAYPREPYNSVYEKRKIQNQKVYYL